MCVIAYVEKQKNMPSLDMLEDMEMANNDGGGYACLTPKNKILWRKGISARNMRDGILAGRITAPAAFHFRIATSGGVKPELCHPFPLSRTVSTALSGTARSVLFHNGHWMRGELIMDIFEETKSKFKGPWSDSRAIALAVHRGLMKPATIAQEAGRLLVFNPEAQIMYGDWETTSGVKVSNTYWNDYGYTTVEYHPSRYDDVAQTKKQIKEANTSLMPYNGPGSDAWDYGLDDASLEKPKNGDVLPHWSDSFESEASYQRWIESVRGQSRRKEIGNEESYEGYAG